MFVPTFDSKQFLIISLFCYLHKVQLPAVFVSLFYYYYFFFKVYYRYTNIQSIFAESVMRNVVVSLCIRWRRRAKLSLRKMPLLEVIINRVFLANYYGFLGLCTEIGHLRLRDCIKEHRFSSSREMALLSKWKGCLIAYTLFIVPAVNTILIISAASFSVPLVSN